MCLQRESPFGVLFDEIDGFRQYQAVLGEVACIARLYEAVFCRQVAIIFYIMFTVKDHFQFVIMPWQRFGVRNESVFWGKRCPVYVCRKRMRSVGLHAYKFFMKMEKFNQTFCQEQRRFATRDDHVLCRILADCLHDACFVHLYALVMVGVAEGTLEIAATEAYKHRWRASEEAFALQGIEYLVYSHHRTLGQELFVQDFLYRYWLVMIPPFSRHGSVQASLDLLIQLMALLIWLNENVAF